MTRPNNSFTTLGGGVPVHYDRRNELDYGTRGGGGFTFFATSSFESKLDACFAQIWELSPFGRAEVITTAGAWVPKPNSFHNDGRALDLDGIFWRDKPFVTLHDGFQGGNRPLYFAIEAIIRMHFGQVLNYNFNAAHRDHFHISDTSPGFNRSSMTATFFLQNALTFVLGHPVGRDGIFGNETRGALDLAMDEMGITGSIDNSLDVYRQFLTGVARAGFRLAAPSPGESPLSPAEDFVAPSTLGFLAASEVASVATESESPATETAVELLANAYAVIDLELGNTSLRPKIEGAVTAFANHPDIQRVIAPADEPTPTS